MKEETIATDASVEAPTEETNPVVDEVVTPASEESVDEDLSEYGVPPMPTEEEEKTEEPKLETPPAVNGEDKQEEEVVLPPITQPEARTTRLEKRIAKIYIRNLRLSGEDEDKIPSEEAIFAELKQYSIPEKAQSLKMHLRQGNEMMGKPSTGNVMDEEDMEAIRDAERESIRQEIITEQHEVKYKEDFVAFMDSHPELDASKKEHNPKLEKAVAALLSGGMPIAEAYETVSELTTGVKVDEHKEAELNKQKLLGGLVSATNDVSKGAKNMTWEEFDKLRTSDPDKYEKLLDSGYQPSDD
ncbi:MAG: hypothetical protein WC823_00205 [Parcubacteria group bacterium]|jgi:hypothetical protein